MHNLQYIKVINSTITVFMHIQIDLCKKQSIENRSVNLTIYIAEQSSLDSAFCRGTIFRSNPAGKLKMHPREHQSLLVHNITINSF